MAKEFDDNRESCEDRKHGCRYGDQSTVRSELWRTRRRARAERRFERAGEFPGRSEALRRVQIECAPEHVV
jgi:hypothetical protein